MCDMLIVLLGVTVCLLTILQEVSLCDNNVDSFAGQCDYTVTVLQEVS